MYSFKLSKAAIYQHSKKPAVDKTAVKNQHNHGRPRKISPREQSLILRQTSTLPEQYGSFTESKRDYY